MHLAGPESGFQDLQSSLSPAALGCQHPTKHVFLFPDWLTTVKFKRLSLSFHMPMPLGSRGESPASRNEGVMLQADIHFTNSSAGWDVASHSSCLFPLTAGGLQSHKSASRRNHLCFSYAASGKILILTRIANKDNLQALGCLSPCEEVSQVCPESFQGSFSFLSLIFIVQPSLYLLLSGKVDSK